MDLSLLFEKIVDKGWKFYWYFIVFILLPGLSLFAVYLIFISWWCPVIPWWSLVESIGSGGIITIAFSVFVGFGIFFFLANIIVMPDLEGKKVIQRMMRDECELSDLRTKFTGKLKLDVWTREAWKQAEKPFTEVYLDGHIQEVQLSVGELNRIGENLAEIAPFEKNEKIVYLAHIFGLTRHDYSHNFEHWDTGTCTLTLDFIVTSNRVLFAQHPIAKVKKGLPSSRIIANHDCYVEPVIADMNLNEISKIYINDYGLVAIRGKGQELHFCEGEPHFTIGELHQVMGFKERTDVCAKLIKDIGYYHGLNTADVADALYDDVNLRYFAAGRCYACNSSDKCDNRVRLTNEQLARVTVGLRGSYQTRDLLRPEGYIGFDRARAAWLERMRELEYRRTIHG